MPITVSSRPPESSTVHPRAATAGDVLAVALLVALLVALALAGHVPLTGPATVAATSGRQGSSAAPAMANHTVAAAALTGARDLAEGVPGSSVVPPAVVHELGYAPVLEGGLASRATGDCSSPVPLPAEFEPACRVHDLGYDLLRVAHRRGAEIPPGLRADLDSLLARQMRGSCGDSVPCRMAAGVAAAAVRVNTLRQGHGAPVVGRLPW